MRRTVIISALSALAILALIAFGWTSLFSTPPGRSLVKTTLETQLSSALGGKVRIGELAGDLPGEVVLHDVIIADSESTWARTDLARLEWRPFALINGKISVDVLALDGVDFLRRPAAEEQDDEDEQRSAIGLPKSLPDISVRMFSISDVRVAEVIAGREVTLDGAGALRTDDGLVRLRFDVSSQSDSDVVNAIVEIDPASDHGHVDIVIASRTGGAIASLLNLGGGAFLELSADAPLSDFTAQLAAEIGAYGSLNAQLKSDLTSAADLLVDADISLGERLSDITEYAGSEAALRIRLRDEGDNNALEIAELKFPNGEVDGVLRWTNRGDRMEKAFARLNMTFADGQLADLQDIFGESVALEAEASFARGAYDVAASLNAPTMSATLTDGRSDLRKLLSGRVSVKTAADALLSPPIAGSIEVSADLDLDEEGRINLGALAAELEDGSMLSGDGAYTPKTRTVAFTGDLSLTPAFLRAQIETFEATAPFVARVTVAGTTDDFSLDIDGESADAAMNGAVIPAAETSARLTGLPSRISAALNAKAIAGDGDLTLLLNFAENGTINATRLHLESSSFNLIGSGAWTPSTQVLSLDLSYDGENGAQPYPGIPLSGVISAKGEIGRGARSSTLVVRAENVASDDITVGALEISASGPADAINLTLAARALAAPGAGFMETLAVDAAVDLTGAPVITLTRLEGERYAVPLALLRPATLKFDDAFEAKNVRMRYGSVGEISLDGRFAPSVWKATIAARDLPAPEVNSIATINLVIDTENVEAANGGFILRPLLASGDSVSIAGDISWDGRRLHVLQTAADSPLTFDIKAPLLLSRTPNLSVSTEGEISGFAALQGALEDVSPYLPEPLQTIEGKADARFTFSGALDAPAVDGEMRVRDGAYTEIASGLTLTNIQADAVAVSNADETTIDFAATARGAGQKSDTVRLTGTTQLGDASSIDVNLTLDKAAFSAGPVSQAIASGAVRLSGPMNAMTATGEISVVELNAEIVTPESGGLVDIEVVDANGVIVQAPSAKVDAPSLTLDVTVTAKDRVFIRGRGLESEWKANVEASGDAQSPIILGTMEMNRGTLDFSGRRFDFTTGLITFDKLSQNDPTLSLRAEYETSDDVTAAIVVSGRASSPSVSLTSSSSLPSEDVMALILFGKSAAELSALESLQVAEALAQLSGVGPFGSGGGVTGLARQALGLDLLNVDLDTDAGASSLEVGKYVAQGLFVSAKQDARGENGSVNVEYEITDSISIETELQQDGDQTISANWKRDF